MSKRLICPKRKTVTWEQIDVPSPQAGEAQVRHQFGAEKHGTMMAFYKGYGNDRGRWDKERRIHIPGDGVLWEYPVPLGNMNVGIVEAVGRDVATVKEGDRVLTFGGFQPVANKPAEACWPLPDDVPWQTAVCLDPANFALCAARDGDLRIGDRLAVFGLGAIGLMCVQIGKASGAEVIIAVDPLPHRREIALKLGATHAIDPTAVKAGESIRELTQGRGADVVIEYSGNARALQEALIGVAFGGTIVAGAFPPPYPAGLDFGGEAHMNRPRIVFSRSESDPNRDHPRWNYRRILEASFELICRGALDGRLLIEPIVAFEALLEEYPNIAAHPENNIKLGVRYPN